MALPSTPTAVCSSSDAPLIERTRELAAIERALDRLADGNGGVLSLSGEPGIGKTRLAREAGALAAERGLHVHWGRAAAGETLPLAPLVDALGERATGDLQTLRERLLADGPALLVLDDLHWADAATLALTAELLRAADLPLLTVLSCACGRWPKALTGPLCDAAQRPDRLARLELGPLSCDGIDTLLGPIGEPAQRRRVQHESGGNPRYALELERAAGSTMPSSLLAVIGEDLQSLSDSALRLLQAGAVVGDSFPLGLASGIAWLGPTAVSGALAELGPRGLVERSAPGRWRFARPIVRQAVYETMGLAARLSAHQRAARELDACGAPVVARAHHVEHAVHSGRRDVRLLLDAAEASAASAPELSARWYGVALRGMDDGDPRRPTTLLQTAAELLTTGRMAQGRELFDEAERMTDTTLSHATPALLAGVRSAQMLALPWRTGPLLRQALDHGADGSAAASLSISSGLESWRVGDVEGIVEHARQALVSAPDDDALRASAYGLLAFAEHATGTAGAAGTALIEGERLVHELGDERLAGRLESLLLLGYVDQGLERHAAAAEHFGRGARIARASGNRFLLVPFRVGAAAAALAQGELADADAAAAAALADATELRSPQLELLAWSLKTALSWAHGRLHVALEAAERAARAADQLASGFLTTEARCLLAVARIDTGAAQSGREQLLRHAGGPELPRLGAGLRPGAYAALVRSALELRELEAARGWVERAEASAQELGLDGRRGTAGVARARLLLADGAPGAAAKAAEAAAEAFLAAGRPIDAGRALALAGQADTEQGNRRRALTTLERAHALLADCDAARHRDQVARELRRLGRSTSRPAGRAAVASGVGVLTPREREVSALVAQGLTNRRIAEELFVSVKTVEEHVAHAFEKLEVRSRAALAVAFESGSVSDE